MFYRKISIAAGLALSLVLCAGAAFADDDNINPLTRQADNGVDTPEAVQIRSSLGNPEAGRNKSLLCQGCHGVDGISFEPLVPSLAGQYGKYIDKQLRNYQAGTRSHQIMNAMAGTIASDGDRADIAAFFASQPKMKGSGPGNDAGKELFLHGDISRTVVGCINCHGPRGKGITPRTAYFPVIGGQNKDYIKRQLTLFRDGWRTNSPSGVMNKIAKKLTDDEIEAIAEYAAAQ